MHLEAQHRVEPLQRLVVVEEFRQSGCHSSGASSRSA
jgi:hypothetical protein